jgi:DNA-binding transcriptional LysR family regulator
VKFLETFVLCAKYRSVTSVAQRLHSTEATIMARIDALESAVSLSLFKRQRGKILEPTSAGKFLLQNALKVVESYELFRDKTLELSTETKKIRLGVGSIITKLFLEKILSEIDESEINVEVVADFYQSEDISIPYGDDEIDIGIQMMEMEGDKYTNQLLCKVKFIWVASPRYRLNEAFDNSLLMLKKEYLLLPPLHSPLFSLIRNFFKNSENSFPIKFASSHIEIISQKALAGLGVAILPKMLVQDMLAAGSLVEIFIEREFPEVNYFMSHKKSNDCPVVQEVEELILKSITLLSS